MFKTLIKKLNYIITQSRVGGEPQPPQSPNIAESLAESLGYMKGSLGEESDIRIREFCIGPNDEYKVALIFIDGMADTAFITDAIMKPLMHLERYDPTEHSKLTLDDLRKKVICAGEITPYTNYEEIINACINGSTILLLDGEGGALGIDTKGWDIRSIAEPQTEAVVRGPREGFTENLRTNVTLIRRKIRSSKLKIESMKIGRKTRTEVVISYIEGVARPEIVELVKKRLKAIKVDAILDSGYIEEYITDNPLSLFSSVGFTEKPDVAAAKILEGRVGIIVDGSPFALTVPMFFVESFQMSEDYYTKPVFASITRLMRMVAYMLAIFAVPVFIALTTFHQELIPTTLLLSLIDAKEGTPFPAFFETLIMLLAFEILREAGLRLPRAVGQAVSIVGALIIGEAAVSAGLVGTAVVITVALSAVASYTVPSQAETISILRIIMLLVATLLGGYGLGIGFLIILTKLARMRSFGVPYLGMLDPNRNFQDSFFRAPLSFMAKRPLGIAGLDDTRLRPFYPPAGKYQEEQNAQK